MHLIGLVAATPLTGRPTATVTVLVVTGDDTRRDRHRVVAEGHRAASLQSLRVGQPIVVIGTLRRDERGRVVVLARDLWPTDDARPAPGEVTATGGHASPREHDRSGHWRRIAIGSPREHLVWVRGTRVGRPREATRSPGR